MAALGSTTAPVSPTILAVRLAALRLASGVSENPIGPVVVAPVARTSSFGGFPSAPLATPALNPQAVIAAYALGD